MKKCSAELVLQGIEKFQDLVCKNQKKKIFFEVQKKFFRTVKEFFIPCIKFLYFEAKNDSTFANYICERSLKSIKIAFRKKESDFIDHFTAYFNTWKI